MLITLLLSIMMMAGLFLLLWGGVGFIQDKRFMSSAPKEALAVAPDRLPERFKGQYALGYVMVTMAFALMGGSIVLGAWHGIVTKAGRYGGTYAHSDIALEFASWISAGSP